MNETDKQTEAFTLLCKTIEKLRGPGGCPWDIEQTPLSLRNDLVEETYECIEAITDKDTLHIMEELGDLYLVVTMLSYMHEQQGAFTITDALNSVTEKLIRRHPHVFSDQKVRDTEEVLDNWAKIKVEQEGRKPKESLLDEVQKALPPLERAFKLQKKAAKAGFDWPDVNGVIEKINEELLEVRTEIFSCKKEPPAHSDSEKLEEELGDLLFSVVNLCRFLKIDPSSALLKTNSKFIKRFGYMEKKMKEHNINMSNKNLESMDKFWNETKCLEDTLD